LNNNRNANNNNRRRGRGSSNNRQQGGQQLNRIDSRARGNAPQMLEKYRKLAHDSHLNGDRVTEEYYLQFADHYFRVIADQRVRQDEQRQPRPNDRPAEYGDEYAEDDFYGDANSPYDRAGNYAPSVQGSTQGNTGQPQPSQNQNGNGQQNPQGGNGQNPQGGNGSQGQESRGNDNRGNDNRNNDSRNNYEGRNNDNRNEGRSADRNDNRGDRGRRNDNDRNNRQDRSERPVRNDGPSELPFNETQPVAAQPAIVEPVDAPQANEPSVYEPVENPFVRADRAPRAPRARKPRREDAGDAVNTPAASAGQDEPAANLDLSSLPPAISRRDEAPSEAPAAEEAPAKPKRRTRRAAPPADDAPGTLENVN
jgi:hypothetical protein